MDVIWFRPPAGDDPGTLNACYNALDIHVIRGRADQVALSIDGIERSYARMLTEVAACAGVLSAFGVGVGDRVVLGFVPPEISIVVVLAVARVGGVVVYDNSPGAVAQVRVAGVEGGVAFVADGQELDWEIALRAGRTDPAGTADVPGDAILACHGADTLSVLDALGGTEGPIPTTAGATLVEVGGARLWCFLSE